METVMLNYIQVVFIRWFDFVFSFLFHMVIIKFWRWSWTVWTERVQTSNDWQRQTDPIETDIISAIWVRREVYGRPSTVGTVMGHNLWLRSIGPNLQRYDWGAPIFSALFFILSQSQVCKIKKQEHFLSVSVISVQDWAKVSQSNHTKP